MFELENVSFSVPGRTLLHPLSLQLGDGRMIGLIGHKLSLIKI